MRSLCPCGSKKTYWLCCQPYISGKIHPLTAEALMRSRYTAFVKNKTAYLILTMSGPALAKAPIHSLIPPGIKWIKLDIHEVIRGEADDDYGEVFFTAFFKEKKTSAQASQTLKEHSTFKKINGHWSYVDCTDDLAPPGTT